MTKKIILRLLLYGSLGIIFFCIFSDSQIKHAKSASDYYYLSKQLELQGRYEDAEKAVKKAIELNPQLGKAYLMLGAIYERMAEYDKAVKVMIVAIEKLKGGQDRDNEERVYYNLAALYETLKEPNKAWEYFEVARKIGMPNEAYLWKSDDPKALIHYVVHGDKEGYRQAVLNDKGLPPSVFERINKIRSYHYGRKVNQLRKYIADNPNVPFLYKFQEELAWALQKAGRNTEALVILKKLEKENIPEIGMARIKFSLFYIYKYLKNYKRSLVYLDDLLQNYPEEFDWSFILWNKAEVFKEMQAIQKEKETLRHINEKYEHTRWGKKASSRLAEIFLYEGNYKDSFEYSLRRQSPWSLSRVFRWGCFLAFLCIGVLFILHRIFLFKKIEEVRTSHFRLRHLFVFSLVSLGMVSFSLQWSFMAYNYYIFDIFSRLKLNPVFLAQLIQDSLVIGLIVYFLGKRYGLSVHEIGLRLRGIRYDIGLGIILALLIFGFGFLYSALLSHIGLKDLPVTYLTEVFNQLLLFRQSAPFLLFIILTVIIGPIYEELVFRVFLLKFIQKYLNLTWAIVLSCLIFAIGHGEYLFLPFYLFVGILLTFVYLKTRSIIPCIIGHALWNLAVIFASSVIFARFSQ